MIAKRNKISLHVNGYSLMLHIFNAKFTFVTYRIRVTSPDRVDFYFVLVPHNFNVILKVLSEDICGR